MIFDQKFLSSYPPFICRVMARRVLRGKTRSTVPITSADIARFGGLSLDKVIWIECQTRWDDVTVGDAVRFLNGCELTRQTLWRLRWFIIRTIGRPSGLRYLELLDEVERKRISSVFVKAFPRWMEEWKNVDTASRRKAKAKKSVSPP